MEWMTYRGESRNLTDINESPWMRLVPGKRYRIDSHTTVSGRVRARVSDGISTAKVNYADQRGFDREWKPLERK